MKEESLEEIKSEILLEEEVKPKVASPVIDDQRMSLKRKLETPEKSAEAKNRNVAETPPPQPRVAPLLEEVEEVFKPPFPPAQPEARKSIRPFEIFEDDETFCSTQKFNLFVKATSISTPNNTKKTVPRLVPLQPIPLHDSPEKSPPQQESKIQSESEDSPNSENAQHNQQPTVAHKQLSTIMEVTETTQSTKSSCCENETLHAKTPMSTRKRDVEVEQSGRNAFEIFRIPEEQTDTLPYQKSMKLPRACELVNDSIQRPLPMAQSNTLGEVSVMQIPKLNESGDEAPMEDDRNVSVKIQYLKLVLNFKLFLIIEIKS